jgi:uncharacterized membrane protein YeaQ/YmgE (transglycosylase-associated protein family)
MTIQAVLLGVIAATLAGALFHFWKNGGFGKLLLYLTLSWVGFFAGHGLAQNTGIELVGHWLSLVRVERSS